MLFVIVAHISWIQSELADRVWFHVQPWTGVDLFFVISGFVVSGAFERDVARFASHAMPGLAAALAFYTKRAARILPTAATGLVFWWLGWMFFNTSGSWGEGFTGDAVTGMLLSNLLFFSNYAMVLGGVPSQLGWYWSLCVEEHFYLIYPSFRLLTTTIRQRARVLCVVILLTVFVFRLLSDNPQALQQLSHNRFDQLAFGVLLHLAWQRWTAPLSWIRSRVAPSASMRTVLGTLAVLLLFTIATFPTVMTPNGPADVNQIFLMRVGLVVTGVLSLALVGLASLDLDLLTFGFRPVGAALLAIGTRSYALYMFHMPAKWIAQELTYRHPSWVAGHMPNGMMILIYVLVLAVLVELNFRLIERPFIAWGRRRVRRLTVEASFDRAPGRRGRLRAALGALVLVAAVAAVVMEFRARRVYVVPPGVTFPVTEPAGAAVRYLRQHGTDAIDVLLPSTLYLDQSLPLLPIGGLPNVTTVWCHDRRAWQTYVSDRFGFNNTAPAPDRPSFLLLGDELAGGACVPRELAIAGRLAGGGASVVSLAMPGHSTLTELAALREYGLAVRPRTIVWAWSEATDVGDLLDELRSPVLPRYLSPDFSQRLRERQADVTGILSSRLAKQIERETGAPLPPVSVAAVTAAGMVPDQPSWGHWFDFPALKRSYFERSRRDAEAGAVARVVQRALAMAPPAVPSGEPRLLMAGYLHDAWAVGQQQANAQGARLIVLYLPDRRRFDDSGFGEGPRPQVLAIARDLKIPVVDGAALLAATDRPLDYFDTFLRADAHQLFAAAIETVAGRDWP